MNNDVIYDESKNPEKAQLPGVPLANFSADQFKALPAWLQTSVAACPFYSVPESLVPVLDVPPGTPISADIPPADEVNPDV